MSGKEICDFIKFAYEMGISSVFEEDDIHEEKDSTELAVEILLQSGLIQIGISQEESDGRKANDLKEDHYS